MSCMTEYFPVFQHSLFPYLWHIHRKSGLYIIKDIILTRTMEPIMQRLPVGKPDETWSWPIWMKKYGMSFQLLAPIHYHAAVLRYWKFIWRISNTCLQFSVRRPFKQGTIMYHNRSFHYTVTARKNTIYLAPWISHERYIIIHGTELGANERLLQY